MDSITTVSALKAFLEANGFTITGHDDPAVGSDIVWLNDEGSASTGVQITTREVLADMGQDVTDVDTVRIDFVDGNGTVWAEGVNLASSLDRLHSAIRNSDTAFLGQGWQDGAKEIDDQLAAGPDTCGFDSETLATLYRLGIPPRLIGIAAAEITEEDDNARVIFLAGDRDEWTYAVEGDPRIEGITLRVNADGLEPGSGAAAVNQLEGYQAARSFGR